MKSWLQVTAILGGVAASFPAAAEYTWEFNINSSTNSACTTSGACPWTATRNPSSATAGAPALTASGLSNTGGLNPDTASTTGHLQSAYLPAWGSNGLGVINRDAYTVLNNGSATDGGSVDNVEGAAAEHSVDSSQRYDAVLYSFSEAVKLTGVKIGWSDSPTDADITILAFTDPGAAGACTPGAIGGTGTASCKWGALAGWSLVGNYGNLVVNAKENVSTTTFAQNWIVAAYLPAYGTTSANGKSLGAGNDYVKLLSVYGDTTKKVPEPGSLALLGVVAGGAFAFRRRPRQGGSR